MPTHTPDTKATEPQITDTPNKDTQDTAQAKPKPKPPSLIRGLLTQLWRTFKFYTRLVIYIPLILLVLIALALGTPIGTKVAVTIASQLLPNVELDYQSGTLNNDLALTYAFWQMDGIKVELNDLQLRWTPRCFINKQLCVETLHASKVAVDIQTSQFASNSDKEPNTIDASDSAEITNDAATTDEYLRLPFDISLHDANLSKVTVTVNDMAYNAENLKASAIWNESGLEVEHISSLGLEVIIPLADKPDDASKDNLQAEQWAMAELPAVRMPFKLFIKELVSQDSLLQLGNRQDKFSHIAISGSYIDYHISLSQLLVNHTYGEVDLIGDIQLIDHYPMNIKAHADIDHISELAGFTQQILKLEINDDFSKLAVNANLSGKSILNLQGIIDLTKATMPFEAEVKESLLQWPLTKPLYLAEIKQLKAKGNIDDLQATVAGHFTSPYHPKLALASSLGYTDKALSFYQLSLISQAGNIQLSGDVSFNNTISWLAQVNVEDIRLQNIDWLNEYTPLKSKINGNFSTSGVATGKTWQAGISDAQLKGRMNGYPLTVSGQVHINQDLAVNAQNLNAEALGASLFINGRADEIWDIDAKLDVPDLSQWVTGARGSIHAKVDVTGNSKNPIVDIDASIEQASYSGGKLDITTLKAHYLPLNQHQYTAELNSENMYFKGYKLDSLKLTSQGNESSQKTAFKTAGDISISTDLNSQTDTNKQTVFAQFSTFNIDNVLGHWQLDDPIDITWDQLNNKGSIDAFCLTHPQNKLCLTNTVSLGNKGQADINFSGNPGQLLAPILSKNIQWDGEAALTSQIRWQPKSKPTATLNFTLLPGNIKLVRNVNNIVDIDYQQLILASTLDEKQFKTRISADSTGIASLDTQININVTPDRAIEGFLNINSLNLEPFGEFFPRLETLQGNLSSKIDLAGSLMTPELTGQLKLAQGAFALSSNPTLIEQTDLTLQLYGQQATIDGKWYMGEGLATTNGKLYWPDGKISGDINVKGEKLAVIQPPLAILDVSPDLNIQFDMQQIALKGAVSVPSGQIKIMQLSEGGVALSDDVVFNDSISELEVKTNPYAIVADINIDVGDNLTVDGMGLTGKLLGSLRLQQQAFKPPLLFGDIKVMNGNYKFMGQTLKINAGEVQFVGPVEVPNLNIEATKEIKEEDIIAGVRVTGTPASPVVSVFSNPSKEQAEVLSYILTGKGFNNTSNEQNNSLMMGAALSLGAQVDGGAINNIGSTARGVIEKFGFSNVQLNANDDGRVAISGFIGEDLMIKYGIGVFNPGYEMTVRYYLFSQLYLESVSGTISQSLDIYYSYDFD
ncbi:translocation/assembly module TamB domain-containing protein [Shewanella gaetbuli]|uniref:Translocation/assembly module TamB domain-containing protein n=1 Tax=Shewanella gaetbuli TaxID=220752 RepID=A0A9X1ZKB7_9GAMM|nr:translocation/assembly module TamB domain-containing protein [Shewanella gaetbuli]MCL1143318.1 translocation/assembly module TamB domain-containing protein [Shewanella gaetbuli]